MARFFRYTSTYKDADDVEQSVTYFRAISVADAREADERNDKEALAEYERACASGQAKEIVTSSEEVD